MIKEYRFGRGMNYAKFEQQCGGEVVDFVEGALLDSVLIEGRRGLYFLKDTFLNEWCSTYTVYFAAYKNSDDCETLWSMWDTFAGADVVAGVAV